MIHGRAASPHSVQLSLCPLSTCKVAKTAAFYATYDKEKTQTGVAQKKGRREDKLENSIPLHRLEEDAKNR